MENLEGNEGQARAELLAQDLADEFADHKSLGFYRRIARLLPEHLLHQARSLVRDAAHRGQIRRSPGKLFTATVKRLAQEARINLKGG